MRKIVIFLIVALIVAFIADYYGYVSLPWLHREGPTMIDTKKELIHKSKEGLESTGGN